MVPSSSDSKIDKHGDALKSGLIGGVAQLGERLNGIQKVGGSIPLVSTTLPIFSLKSFSFSYVVKFFFRFVPADHLISWRAVEISSLLGMAVRKILRIGNPLLRKLAEDVLESEVQTKDFKKLIRDMFETMRFAEGVGLAAPQIGILKKIVVVGQEDDNQRYKGTPEVPNQVIINPEITPLAPAGDGFWEGCLSVPGMRGYVERPSKINLKWRDENFEPHEETIEGYRAIVMQHEIDHLFGVLYVDRLKSTKLFGYNEDIDTEGKILD
ncbi:hypothetical protein LPTSP3_g19520 [Leptospira kobayashii]|uniref:Peptide deformylase n=2 Tax=Leptospira kobayashii TaxID=1917830 RepID=A0ABN6KGD3_9LEPT|nr:hypothetical protein LPTSP3_g19520 [Leptospira kobayashii]